jgi:hypothetical protein
VPQTEKHKQIKKKTHLHPFQVFSVVTCLGNKPANTKSNGTIYKGIVNEGIVKTNARVQSFFAGLRYSWQQNHKFDKLVCVDASSSKNIQTPVALVNYHFL